jgi:hypothetical protein
VARVRPEAKNATTQNSKALSSFEAKLVATQKLQSGFIWFRKLLTDIHTLLSGAENNKENAH